MSVSLSTEPGRRQSGLSESILTGGLLLFGVLAMLVQVNPALHGLDRDSGIYTYFGDEILRGKVPYQDVWDHKAPLMYYLNALALWLGHGSRWGTWALEFICLLGAAYAAYRVMKVIWGRAPALLGVGLLLYGFERTFENGNFTEEYPLPLHFASIALMLRAAKEPRQWAWNFLIGILLAVCFLFRANNTALEVAVVLTLAILRILERDHRALLAQLSWIALGTFVPIAITVLYFWSLGLLKEMLNASILYNLAYSGADVTGSSSLDVGLRAFGVLPLVLTVLGYAVAVLRLGGPLREKSVSIALVIGLPLAFLVSDPARRTYLHYYMNWLPFIALLGALAFDFALSKWLPSAASAGHAATIALAGAWVIVLVFFVWTGRPADVQKTASMFIDRQNTGIEYAPTLAVYVEKHTGPNDTVLFWGVYPGMNFLSKRESASGILFYPLFVASPMSNDLEARFLEDLLRNKPALIVDMNDPAALSLDPIERQQQLSEGLGWPFMPGNIGQVWDFIAQNYAPSTKVSGHEIYALKSGT